MRIAWCTLLVACKATEAPPPVAVFDEPTAVHEVAGDLRTYATTLVDLDRDGSLELVAGGFAARGGGGRRASVFVYRRDGDGWKPVTEGGWLGGGGGGGSTVRNVEVADLDGDGTPEIVALGRVGKGMKDASARLVVLALRGGTLHEVAKAEWNLARYTHGYGLAIGDLDGDHRPEIVTTGFSFDGTRERGFVRVWSHDLTLEREATLGGDASLRLTDVAIGDADGDGRADIAVAGRSGPYRADGTNGDLAQRAETGELAVFDAVLELRARHAWHDGSTLRLRAVAIADGHVIAGGQFDADGRPCLAVFELHGDTLVMRAHALGDGRGDLRDLVVADGRILATGPAGELKPSHELAMWRYDGGELHRELVTDAVVRGPDGSIVTIRSPTSAIAKSR